MLFTFCEIYNLGVGNVSISGVYMLNTIYEMLN